MKDSAAVAAAFVVLVLATAGLFFQTWILGIILSWFNVTLTFWQNFLIILLANSFRTNVSSK